METKNYLVIQDHTSEFPEPITFPEVDTNQVTPLSLRLNPIPTPAAIEILDRIISDANKKNEEPEQEAGVVRETRGGSRASQP